VDQLGRGSVLGERYRLTGLAQAVSPGTVWRAIDQVTGREVAVKTLGAFPANDQASWTRAKLALRVIAGLQYPGIAQVYDYGQVATHAGIAVPYLVRELVEGETLEQRLGGGPLPVGEALRIVAAIADALAAVHGAGLVHGNLVPANVVLGSDGVRVTDVGLWVLRDRRPAEKLFPSALSYAAPERAAGAPATPATDMYSLGVVFVACLTGITAVGGTGAAPRPEMSGDTVAAGLASLWAACLGANPSDRPSAAHAAVMSRQLISTGTQPAADPAAAPGVPLPAAGAGSLSPSSLSPGSPSPGSPERGHVPAGTPASAAPPGAAPPVPPPLVLQPGPAAGQAAEPSGVPGHARHRERAGLGARGRRAGGRRAGLRPPGRPGGRLSPARRGGLLAIGGAATGVTVAVVLVLAQFLSAPAPATNPSAASSNPPHTARATAPRDTPTPGASAEATSSVPAPRTSRTTPLDAIDTLWRTVRQGAANGQIRPDVAVDFENLIGPVRDQLVAGEPAQVTSLVPALREKLAQRLGEGSISMGTARLLGSELTRLSDSTKHH
jgi:serine/threonine-protein kinase